MLQELKREKEVIQIQLGVLMESYCQQYIKKECECLKNHSHSYYSID